MNKNKAIISDAIDHLRGLAKLNKVVYKKSPIGNDFYDIQIEGQDFLCIVQNNVIKANLSIVLQAMQQVRPQTDKPLLLISQYVQPDLYNLIQQENINIVERSGNCRIIAPPLFVHISGQKRFEQKEKRGKAFHEAGIKLIFFFLQDETNVSKPYRQICDQTGSSLGTIKNVVEELVEEHFIVTMASKRVLKNREQLIDLWQVYYNRTLKPKLLIKEFELVDKQDWKQLKLPNNMYWGGESGAYLHDGFLIPEQFEIYADAPISNLLLTHKVRIQDNGNIKVYQKFWKDSTNSNLVPNFLIYADLIGSGNSRCIEAAQKLKAYGI